MISWFDSILCISSTQLVIIKHNFSDEKGPTGFLDSQD